MWCADEKGFNDEVVAGSSSVHTAGNTNPTIQHAKSIRHLTTLSFISASGEASPPAVIVSGSYYHPDWKKIWPEAKIACNPKGSMTGALFVELVAESFVHHIRVTKKMAGWVVLIIDSGGGFHGLHLSMEFALLMYRHEVEVVALREYYTKAIGV